MRPAKTPSSAGARAGTPGSGLLRSRFDRDEVVPGAVVAQRFCARARIASGAMGEVWVGDHLQLRVPVALKILHPEAMAHREIVTRFSREAFLLGQIRSNHVARVYDFISRSRYGPVLVMEFVNGPSLAEVVRSRLLSVEEGVHLGVGLATAVRELHAANVVHRDIKPANVLLRGCPDGTFCTVLVDLGVSRMLRQEGLDPSDQLTEITVADRAVGTAEYMAPEQLVSSRDATPAADLYAIGAVLFRAMTGHNVFGDLSGIDLARRKLDGRAPSLRTGRTDMVARGLEEVVRHALLKSPEDRFESADEMLVELSLLRDAVRRAALGGSLNPRRSISRTADGLPLTRRVRRRRARPSLPRWSLAALALVVVVMGGLIGAHAAVKVLAKPTAPAGDVGRCRIVGQAATRATGGGTPEVSFSIVCPEADVSRTRPAPAPRP